MNLYLVTQTQNNGYDTYDSMVVVAEDHNQARDIHPRNDWKSERTRFIDWEKEADEKWSSWATHREYVTTTLIGEAVPEYTEPQVIIASFNAG